MSTITLFGICFPELVLGHFFYMNICQLYQVPFWSPHLEDQYTKKTFKEKISSLIETVVLHQYHRVEQYDKGHRHY
jgi:hypothetical protein